MTAPTELWVDGGTASAAEGVGLALHDLPQVRVLGHRTAGALGGTRVVPLIDDMMLVVRFGSVFDAAGQPVDGHGLAVVD